MHLPSFFPRIGHALIFVLLGTITLLNTADSSPTTAPASASATDHIAKPLIYDDPSSTDDDYIIQGEYLGQDPMGQKIGVQIIALGNNSFEYVSYPGGLPGIGWNGDRKKLTRLQANRNPGDTTVVFRTDSFIAEVDGNKIFVTDPHHKALMELERIDRQSPTLGAHPPQGAVVLFDDKGNIQFNDAKVTKDGLLPEGATSKESYTDFTLHLEFRLPYIPAASGQHRGNSGIYLQGRYEVQLLDSFGLEGKNNECGAIYQVAAPKVNMCYPPLTWQTLDIDFTAARFDSTGNKTANAKVTIKHNGVVVHENLEIPHTTVSAPNPQETPAPGPIHLQNHGNPIRFRNIWVIHNPTENR